VLVMGNWFLLDGMRLRRTAWGMIHLHELTKEVVTMAIQRPTLRYLLSATDGSTHLI
jgi:hypothetical protein